MVVLTINPHLVARHGLKVALVGATQWARNLFIKSFLSLWENLPNWWCALRHMPTKFEAMAQSVKGCAGGALCNAVGALSTSAAVTNRHTGLAQHRCCLTNAFPPTWNARVWRAPSPPLATMRPVRDEPCERGLRRRADREGGRQAAVQEPDPRGVPGGRWGHRRPKGGGKGWMLNPCPRGADAFLGGGGRWGHRRRRAPFYDPHASKIKKNAIGRGKNGNRQV